MNRDEVINYIRSLTDLELTELFYEATSERWMDGDDSRLILALATQYGDSESAWGILYLALHDPTVYPQGWDPEAPFCQEAGNLLSYAKHMISPFDGTPTYGT
jgi:hypothetical protein